MAEAYSEIGMKGEVRVAFSLPAAWAVALEGREGPRPRGTSPKRKLTARAVGLGPVCACYCGDR